MQPIARLSAAWLLLSAAMMPMATVSASPVNRDVRDMPVVRHGSQLLLNGKPWKAVGPNIYWLGLDENVVPPAGEPYYAPYTASYPTKGRVTEMMAVVKAMGGTAIRAHTLGVSYGNPLSLWPAAHETNAEAWEAIDWAVYQARVYGLRLVIPLMDNYDYYHGGKYTFLRWGGFNITGSDSHNPVVQAFYTDAGVNALFHEYIRVLLTHVNPYTRLSYAEDPTIFAYETGNELTGPVWKDENIPLAWLRSVGGLVKKLAPHKLVVDGTYGVNKTNLAAHVHEIDILSNHYYPVNLTLLQEDLAAVKKAGKVYLAGEYSWTGEDQSTTATNSLLPFFRELETGPAVAGDMMWSMFGHNVPNCTSFVEHNDGLALQYGNPANSDDTTARIKLLRQHWMAAGQGIKIAADADLPTVACPASARG